MKKVLSMLLLCIALQGTGNAIDTWTTPETISSTGVNSFDPRLAMDATGDSVAIWLEGSALVAKTKVFGGSWSSASTLAASGASEPELVVDPSGNATAVWVEGGVVKSSRKPFGMSWETATTLSGASSSAPAIANDTAGNVVAVWVESGVIKSKTRPSGMSWSGSADTLSTSGSGAPQVAIGADTDHTVVAVWHTLNGVTSYYNVNSTSKTITGGTWSAAGAVSDPDVNAVYPHVDVDENGDGIAIWYRYNLTGAAYSNVVLQSSFHPSAGSWSTPTDLLVNEEGYAKGNRNPAELSSEVQFNGGKQAMAIWTNSFPGSQYALNSAQTLNGLNWQSFNLLLADPYTFSADLALNAIGDAACSYMAFDPTDDLVKIYVVESHIGNLTNEGWTAPQLISDSGQNAYPSIGLALTGATGTTAQVAWLNYDGANNIVRASTGSGAIVLPASNLDATQSSTNFGVFVEYFNTLTWDASSDPDLLTYALYRNGEFLASLPSGQTSYVDGNQTQGGTVTYGVAAINNLGNQSGIVTFTIFP